jgi:hypothetical protein
MVAASHGDGLSMAEAATRLNNFVVAAPGERNYFVQPEGLAAVKAFLESPHAQPKTYAIVDIGAGTTEVSFFFSGGIMKEPGLPLRPSYLADPTQAVGGGKNRRGARPGTNRERTTARTPSPSGSSAESSNCNPTKVGYGVHAL